MPESFTDDMIRRARWARDHNNGHPNPAWSTGEKLIIALILGNEAYLHVADYTKPEALQRLSGDLFGSDPEAWLADVRATL
jgi:hypothetical protein